MEPAVSHLGIQSGVLDLDCENDLILMELIGNYLFENKKEFKEIYDNI